MYRNKSKSKIKNNIIYLILLIANTTNLHAVALNSWNSKNPAKCLHLMERFLPYDYTDQLINHYFFTAEAKNLYEIIEQIGDNKTHNWKNILRLYLQDHNRIDLNAFKPLTEISLMQLIIQKMAPIEIILAFIDNGGNRGVIFEGRTLYTQFIEKNDTKSIQKLISIKTPLNNNELELIKNTPSNIIQ